MKLESTTRHLVRQRIGRPALSRQHSPAIPASTPGSCAVCSFLRTSSSLPRATSFQFLAARRHSPRNRNCDAVPRPGFPSAVRAAKDGHDAGVSFLDGARKRQRRGILLEGGRRSSHHIRLQGDDAVCEFRHRNQVPALCSASVRLDYPRLHADGQLLAEFDIRQEGRPCRELTRISSRQVRGNMCQREKYTYFAVV